MALVLELDALSQARSCRLRRMDAFEGLDAGLFVGADDVTAFGGQARRIRVGLAHFTDIGLVLLGVLELILRGQPVLRFVRAEIPPFSRRSTCLGEIDSTMLRLITSSASSRGVQ